MILLVALERAANPACPPLVDNLWGKGGGGGVCDCRWKLISIAHPNPENGYAAAPRGSNIFRLYCATIARSAYTGGESGLTLDAPDVWRHRSQVRFHYPRLLLWDGPALEAAGRRDGGHGGAAGCARPGLRHWRFLQT